MMDDAPPGEGCHCAVCEEKRREGRADATDERDFGGSVAWLTHHRNPWALTQGLRGGIL